MRILYKKMYKFREDLILGTFIKRHYLSSSNCPPIIVSSEQIPEKNI